MSPWARAAPEHFLRLDERTGELLGLLPRIEREVSVTERHRVVKVWRALWVKMAAMGFCSADADPAKAFRNSAPDPRQAAWQRLSWWKQSLTCP